MRGRNILMCISLQEIPPPPQPRTGELYEQRIKDGEQASALNRISPYIIYSHVIEESKQLASGQLQKRLEVQFMNEITYHREGDYMLPNLLPPEAPLIGAWGMMRKRF